MADPEKEVPLPHRHADGWPLQDVTNAMVARHKEQFGRGPTKAQSRMAGADALLCVLDDALLPAERKMVEMGEHQRVPESRMFFQVATAEQFVAAVEHITGLSVRAFTLGAPGQRTAGASSACGDDPEQAPTRCDRGRRSPHSEGAAGGLMSPHSLVPCREVPAEPEILQNGHAGMVSALTPLVDPVWTHKRAAALWLTHGLGTAGRRKRPPFLSGD
jgi:uncharacterized protein YbcI